MAIFIYKNVSKMGYLPPHIKTPDFYSFDNHPPPHHYLYIFALHVSLLFDKKNSNYYRPDFTHFLYEFVFNTLKIEANYTSIKIIYNNFLTNRGQAIF